MEFVENPALAARIVGIPTARGGSAHLPVRPRNLLSALDPRRSHSISACNMVMNTRPCSSSALPAIEGPGSSSVCSIGSDTVGRGVECIGPGDGSRSGSRCSEYAFSAILQQTDASL